MTTPILITGFGPFPAARDNPSGHLVERLRLEAGSFGAPSPLAFGVLPTEWQRIGPAFAALLAEHRPRFALHFGYAASAPGFQLERCAYNERCGREDGCGDRHAEGVLAQDAAALLTTPHSIDALARRLTAAGVPATPSDDPGRYLCNTLYFLSLQAGLAALFVHIPALRFESGIMPAAHAIALDAAPPLPIERALLGARLIIEALVEGA